MFVQQNTEMLPGNLRKQTSDTFENKDEFQKHMLNEGSQI